MKVSDGIRKDESIAGSAGLGPLLVIEVKKKTVRS